MTGPTEGEATNERPVAAAGTRRLRQVFVSGVAITVPILVTLIVLVFVVDFTLGLVGPLVAFLTDLAGVGQSVPDVALEVLALGVLVVLVFVVGLFAEARSGGGIEAAFDRGVARIPGIGSVYTSFNEMSKLLLSSDSQSFREVKLVEFPTEGSYTVAFVTADAPYEVQEGLDHDDMTTLFMPMAPNPVMGGFVLHVSDDNVYDIDITVEEGIQSIVTSGVTVGAGEAVGEGDVSEIGAIERADVSETIEGAMAGPGSRETGTETGRRGGPGGPTAADGPASVPDGDASDDGAENDGVERGDDGFDDR